ncbi:MAG: hypothetical protein HY954_06705 [Deltaproteobacteria bacterium]|nr:hypothetical protein [Deltaproteobacteria bacterium]
MRNGVTFWTEGGSVIGMGHVVRSINVARAISSREIPVHFLVNSDKAVTERLESFGMPHISYTLEKTHASRLTKDIVVIDTKRDVSGQISALKAEGKKVVLIDNSLSAGYADIHIMPSAFNKGDCGVNLFAGSRFVIIGQNFLNHCQAEKKFSLPLKVLVTMGGADPFKLTELVMEGLKDIKDIEVTVVIGPAFDPDRGLAESLGRDNKIEVLPDVRDMAPVIDKAHIAFTAVGTTIYELAYMGVPSIIVGNYRTDESDLREIDALGIGVSLGYYADLKIDKVKEAVERFKKATEWESFSKNGRALVDGRGASRIAELIDALYNEKTDISPEGI